MTAIAHFSHRRCLVQSFAPLVSWLPHLPSSLLPLLVAFGVLHIQQASFGNCLGNQLSHVCPSSSSVVLAAASGWRHLQQCRLARQPASPALVNKRPTCATCMGEQINNVCTRSSTLDNFAPVLALAWLGSADQLGGREKDIVNLIHAARANC